MNIPEPGLTQTLAKKSLLLLLAISIFLFMALNLGMDKIESGMNGTGYFFSESFMFSSFWWLFVPLLYAQFRAVKGSMPALQYAALLVIPPVLHLLAFPALVWLISSLFYYHTFRYGQTFHFAFTEYLFELVLLYCLPLGCYAYFRQPIATIQIAEPQHPLAAGNTFTARLIVSEGNRNVCIEAAEILYIGANPPYVELHLKNKKYLHKETLKSFVEKLDGSRFIRIHKSVVINVSAVVSYQSTKSGDYDLIITGGTKLRISRNYAQHFKEKMALQHQVTTQ